MAMTNEAKRALSQTIRKLRAQLIEELGEATARAYRLSIEASKADLGEAARLRRARLETWIGEQVRALPEKSRIGAAARLLGDVVKDAAATFLQRLVYLRLLEAAKLRPVAVVTGGWESRGYKDFREAASELVRTERPGRGGQRDESEGYATLLGLVFDELAIDLPGLYGPVRMTSLVPIPAATLRRVITALDGDELATVWSDDTTLGWIYQYWNDPEREALDAKLAASKKLENHEIASKTQMFTERYMVEWLLQNSLGQMWLAMCKKNGWTARIEGPTGAAGDQQSVLDQLEARRIAWRVQRAAGEVALDALMPIERGLEDRWKYWVPQPMPADSIEQAPVSVRDLKLLDPACGSGHFLVIAFELLFHLYKEEGWLRGATSSPDAEGTGEWGHKRIVESILEHNLHGIDIDPKAVQIAAATLMLKARQLCATAEPQTMNLVAPVLSLATLAADDPARRELYAEVEAETGIPPELTSRIVDGLVGADYLGTLLKVDAGIEEAIASFGQQLSAVVPVKADQGSLFDGFAPARRKRITAEHAKAAVLDRIEGFLEHHSGGADLGLRLRGEQLAAGVRFVRLVREGQYDIVVGNPPYQGTSKMAGNAYLEDQYERGKADLYAAFLERGLQLARVGGVSALLTMRNWMFIKQFSSLREWLLATYDLRLLGDVDRGAFDEVPNEVLAAVMSVFRRCRPSEEQSVAMQPTPLDDKSYDRERTRRKRGAMLCQTGRYEFKPTDLVAIESSPVVYWWSNEQLSSYATSPKFGSTSRICNGLQTNDNVRFLRRPWELPSATWTVWQEDERKPLARMDVSSWAPYVKGADGAAWVEPVRFAVLWRHRGLAVKVLNEHVYGSASRSVRNEDLYFSMGTAFTTKGASFAARVFRLPSVFDVEGRAVFNSDMSQTVCTLNSTFSKDVMSSLNPTIHFTAGDVARVPYANIPGAERIVSVVRGSFAQEEARRETSIEFLRPGPSTWKSAQEWAQSAIDRQLNAPLPELDLADEPELATDYLSFAVGVALGRFGDSSERNLPKVASALPHGILFLSNATDRDSLAHLAAAPILAAWTTHGAAIDDKRTLKNYLQDKFFPEVHRKMYENRPTCFPLSSSRKTFVAYVSVHRWTAGTLHDLLAEHLYPAKKQFEGELTDLRSARDGADKKASKAAEKRFGEIGKWLEELSDFITNIEQCAEKGPPPPDGKTKPREVDARYEPVLDDGVMINAAALWPLLEPQWKDPKKWWRELANAEGKKDYDWAHLAKRYFPVRVDAKCKIDPSVAVAHGCFWKYHPAKAYQWELRLQDEIRPDFTLDEVGSDAARAAFETDHPDEVEALVAKEHQRRQRKQTKTGEADEGDESQGALDLAAADSDDAMAGEELSA